MVNQNSRELLTELASLVRNLDYRDRNDADLSNLTKPKTDYSRAFELVQTICERFYGGTESTAVSWRHWEHRPIAKQPQDRSGSLMPLPVADKMQLASRLLALPTLYSDLTIIVVDRTLSDGYISYSATDYDRKDWGDFWPILGYLKAHVDLLEKGRCVFLPVRSTKLYGSMSEETRIAYGAPLLQPSDEMLFTPVNSVHDVLQRSPLDDLVVYENLVLPCFPNAELADIAAIAEKETDSFIIFNDLLRRKLGEISRATSAEALQDVISEIRAGAASLAIEARKISKGKLLNGAELAAFTVSLSVLATPDGAALPAKVAGIIGSVSLLDFLREAVGRRKDRFDIKKSEYYVPYLLREVSTE